MMIMYKWARKDVKRLEKRHITLKMERKIKTMWRQI